MATGEFYEVPEIDPRTATEAEYEACIEARCSTEKATCVGEQLEDLAEIRPEELPPCFLAVQAEALSPTTGWKTKYGEWVPKDIFARLSRLIEMKICNLTSSIESSPRQTPKFSVTTSRLVFQPNDGSKSDLEMIVYNQISFTNKHYLEEDILLCRVFRKGAQPHCQPKSRDAADPVNGFPKDDVSDMVMDEADFKVLSGLVTGFDAEDNGMGGRDLPSIDYFGGPKKRPRLTPAGRSNVWDNFTKIYTKDPKVVYAACNHCGRMFRVIGGSTSSLLKHSRTCQCKPDSSISSVTSRE